MFTPRSISEQLLFSTVRIEATLKNGDTSTGTAFFFSFPLGQNKELPVLITNKHVVANSLSGTFFVHEAIRAGDKDVPADHSSLFMLDKFEQRWFPHPDPEVDLCAMPIQPLLNQASQQGKRIYHANLTADLIPSQSALEDLRAVESILMIGYPNGLWDKANNLPLVRRGITSTHPAVDFNGKPMSVIDMACFPGSSGSPVLVVDEGSYVNKAGTLMAGSNRVILLGVLFAGPMHTATGDIVIREIPTTKKLAAQTPVMMHLGYIAKAKEILALGDAFKKHLRQQGIDIP